MKFLSPSSPPAMVIPRLISYRDSRRRPLSSSSTLSRNTPTEPTQHRLYDAKKHKKRRINQTDRLCVRTNFDELVCESLDYSATIPKKLKSRLKLATSTFSTLCFDILRISKSVRISLSLTLSNLKSL